MVKNSVSEALLELAKNDQNRSETARLRDVINEIEIALNAGVSRAAVLATLHSQGFTLSLRSFETALYRIRKQREKSTSVNQRLINKEPEKSKSPQLQQKINNPSDIRKLRKSDINFDELENDN